MKLGEAQIRENMRVYAIGDVHGCLDELKCLIAMIDNDLASRSIERSTLVFLGDYVDRGPENRGVLDFLIALEESERDCVFLLGNHDERMVTFMTSPELVWDNMMRWGGVETLSNYGVIARPGESIESVSERFAESVPSRHVEFINRLHHRYELHDYFFCHAGVRPHISLAEQMDHDLIWIRHDFLDHEGMFEKVVVHGHTPQQKPEVKPNRINVDTKCYETGILTAAVLEGSNVRFLATGPN